MLYPFLCFTFVWVVFSYYSLDKLMVLFKQEISRKTVVGLAVRYRLKDVIVVVPEPVKLVDEVTPYPKLRPILAQIVLFVFFLCVVVAGKL